MTLTAAAATATVAAKLAALVVPLGLDTFSVALALGVGGLPPERRLPTSVLFAAFEAAMPLLGVVIGLPLAHAIGGGAEYAAAALLAGLGVYMLLSGEEPESRLLSLSGRGPLGAVLLGLSVSLDELAIGVSAGLLRLPLLPLIILVAAQAFIVTQLGVRIGARAGERLREAADRIAAVALLMLGAVLFLTRLSA